MATREFQSPLERVVDDARRILDDLGQSWALIGGLAVSARTEPRFTRDVDFAVSLPGDREAETLIRDIQAHGYQVATVVEQEATGRLATARLQAVGEDHGTVLDLLFASSGIESEIVTNATPVEVFPGLQLPVATVADLLALKILARDDSRRPQDAMDIRALLSESTPADLEATRAALSLIRERGYHRGRDLLGLFEEARHHFRRE